MSITKTGKHATALYVVATPVGNLGDISRRAVEVLAAVDLIAAEDTRHSQKLLSHLGITTRMTAYHEHNEDKAAAGLIDTLRQGGSVALISDAGTPLISDPGYRLLSQAHAHGIRVIPVPGASAAIAALSVAGLPTDRFVFEGFLPARHQARLNALQRLVDETRTIVFYESCHRISESLQDMCEVFGGKRRLTFARELTKAFETVRQLELRECLEWVQQDAQQHKGEIVLVLGGAEPRAETTSAMRDVLRVLLDELPLKQAAALAAKLTGRHRNECYQAALALRDEQQAP